MPERLLVVDDEPGMALGVAETLRRREYTVDIAASATEALSCLARRSYAVVFTDLRMPEMDGHQLLKRVRALNPRTQVVVLTAYASVESAVACVRDGAVDYLTKPFSPDALERIARVALERVPREGDEAGLETLVAEDPSILAAVELAGRAAATDVTVLLEAESGAGKEIFARMIHRQSPREAGPFVAVNCAALPRDLLEAELFGHIRGAFTGATRDRRGHFQNADGGTLLLDEIGEMNTDLQARLLRVLQDRVIQPIGSDAVVRVDVRVIAATNRNLRDDVNSGRFREDLYYRLKVMPIRIPPLRERPADIEPLVLHFLRSFAGSDARLTDGALTALRDHRWPGNVRELQNTLQRATILANGEPIDAQHIVVEPAFPGGGDEPEAPVSLADAERETIHRILVKTRGNRAEAAAALGISPRTLRHKLKQYRDAGRPVLEPGR